MEDQLYPRYDILIFSFVRYSILLGILAPRFEVCVQEHPERSFSVQSIVQNY